MDTICGVAARATPKSSVPHPRIPMQTKFVAAILVWFAPTCAVAQHVAPEPLFDTGGIHGVAWTDGELRAASRGCVARFDAGSVEVTPVLGRRAPREYPLSVALNAVRRGTADVFVASAATPPRLDGESVYYRHRDGLVERYDVRADGIKQSLVLADRPAGHGDLVVRYCVSTELQCPGASAAHELQFTADGLGGIRIGGTVGIDANGNQVDGHMNFDGQTLELVLPHDFVERAAYPVELDPLFGPQLNTGVSFDDQRPDIAYDVTTNVYAVAFEFPVSATTTDVWVMRHDAATGNRLGGTSLASGSGRLPKIASINLSDRFLVVWQDDGAGNGDIVCRGMRASDGLLTNPVTVAGNQTAETAPDVGGDAFDNLDVEGLVVWNEAGVGILGVQVMLATGTGDPVVVGTPVTLDATPQTANPVISRSGGLDPTNGGRYVVVWEVQGPGVTFLNAIGVDRDFNVLTSVALVSAGPVGNADVDGDGSQFLVVYETLEGPAPSPSDVWCQPLEFCMGATALCGPQGAPLANTVNDDELQPAVACFGSMFAVAWADATAGSTTEYRISVSNVVPGACQLCGSQVVTGRAPAWRASQPALCAMRAGGAATMVGLLSWEEREVSTGNSLLRSHRYQPFTGGSVTPLAGVAGCGTGGSIGVNGPFALGNSEFKLTLSGANPSSALAYAILDSTLAAPNTCGTCLSINLETTLPVVAAGGSAELPISIPCDLRFLGATLNAQWIVFTPGAPSPPCPAFRFVSASDALRLVLAN